MDTFYFLVCGALVMWMAAGFAMLEAGLVRAKNTTEILTKNVALFAISCIMYLVCGYSVMYGGEWFLTGIQTVDVNSTLSDFAGREDGFEGGSIYSGASDFFFQVVFVATAMSIVSGAVAERMKLWAFLAFAVVMTGFIYPMEGNWTWGGGSVFGLFSLGDLGFTDFAGSGIVHMAGAAAALAGVLVLGARKGKYGPNGEIRAIPGANLPLATLGTLILWMGWFGFNGGSVLSADAATVAKVFVTTSLAAAGGTIGAFVISYVMFKTHDLSMVLNGILGGLVGITAGADLMSPFAAIIIGIIAGAIIPLSVVMFDKLKLDDPVGATSVHLVCGIWGTLAVGIFGDMAGLGQLGIQFIGVAAIGVFTFLFAFVVFYVLKVTIGIRVSEEEEVKGLDVSEHEMSAYPTYETAAYNLNVQ